MGISSSVPEKVEESDLSNLPEQIDDIAISYILTQNTIDLIRLGDKDYYDNMIVLTSGILSKRLNKLELGFLNKRIQHGQPIFVSDKSDMSHLIPKNDAMKKHMLRNISKYYMKIITVYSAVVSTMDPQYFYEDEDGNRSTFYLKDFKDYKYIPRNAKPRISQMTNPLNLCRKRLNILKNKLSIGEDSITINPGEKLCSMDGPSKRLNEEIGIKELDLLYYDLYDNENKKWGKMSKKMKKKYNRDLTIFYQIFTGKKTKPSDIKSFRDIEMLDFNTFDKCNKDDFIKELIVPKDGRLIKSYLDKIYIIQDHTQSTKIKLMNILKKLFISNGSDYKLNPDLTLDSVIAIEKDTREAIMYLYTTCEKYFIQALLIFEKIYEENTYNLNAQRNNNMNSAFVVPDVLANSNSAPIGLNPIGLTNGLNSGINTGLNTGLNSGINPSGLNPSGLNTGLNPLNPLNSGLNTGLNPPNVLNSGLNSGINPSVLNSGLNPLNSGINPSVLNSGLSGINPPNVLNPPNNSGLIQSNVSTDSMPISYSPQPNGAFKELGAVNPEIIGTFNQPAQVDTEPGRFNPTDTPANPMNPVNYVKPENPFNPMNPVNYVKPENPFNPMNPTNSVDTPITPVTPPDAPVLQPIVPGLPDVPVVPAPAPVAPVVPVAPAPVAPVVPDAPAPVAPAPIVPDLPAPTAPIVPKTSWFGFNSS